MTKGASKSKNEAGVEPSSASLSTNEAEYTIQAASKPKNEAAISLSPASLSKNEAEGLFINEKTYQNLLLTKFENASLYNYRDEKIPISKIWK